jgi:hypothetical protein
MSTNFVQLATDYNKFIQGIGKGVSVDFFQFPVCLQLAVPVNSSSMFCKCEGI